MADLWLTIQWMQGHKLHISAIAWLCFGRRARRCALVQGGDKSKRTRVLPLHACSAKLDFVALLLVAVNERTMKIPLALFGKK
jgi:hypothetical protein